MNKIFKVIWNHSAQRFDVCSELTHAHGKSASSTDERSSVVKTIAISALTAGAVLGSADVMAAIAIGDGSTSGTGATANQATSIVIGNNAKDSTTGATGVAGVADTIVIGNGANIQVSAISSSNPTDSVARNSIVVGKNAHASQRDVVVIGSGASAGHYEGAAVNANTIVIGTNATAMSGQQRTGSLGASHISYHNPYNPLFAGEDGNIANDYVLESSQANHVVVRGPTSSSANTILRYAGTTTNLNGETLIVGHNATAGQGSIAIGSMAYSDGGQLDGTTYSLGVALGHAAYSRTGGIAIGGATAATGANAIAIARQAAAIGDSSIAFGSSSAGVGEQAIAIGQSATAIGNSSISIGGSRSPNDYDNETNTRTYADDSIAIGSYAQAGELAEGGVAVGTNSSVDSPDNIVLGRDANETSVTNDGELGSQNGKDILEATVVGVTYSGFAGGDKRVGVLSIGNGEETRQIVNVAPGNISATSTDAINGSQLYMVAAAIPTVNGTGVTSTTNGDGRTVYTVEIPEIPETPTTTLENIPDGNEKAGSVKEPDNADAFVTAGDIANAINNSGFTLKHSATSEGEDLKGDAELINPGDVVEMIAGKNLSVKQEADGKITYATKENVSFSNITVGVPDEDGEVQNPIVIGDNKISGLDSHLPVDAVDSEGNANKGATNVANPYEGKTAPVTEAATLGDVLNAGWNLQENGNAVDFVTPYNTVNFKQGDGITITSESDGDKSDIIIAVDSAKTVVDPNTGKAVPSSYTTKDADGNDVPVTLSYDDKGNPVYQDAAGNPVDAANVTPVDNTNKVATVGDVIETINNVGWWTNSTSTEGNTEGDAANTLVNPGDQVNFEAGKNMLVEQNVETVDGKDTITYTYKTQDDVEFNTVTLKEPTEITYTDANGNPVTKKGDKFYNADTGEEVPADEVTEVKPDPVPAVVMKTEKATPSNISEITGDEEQPRSALTLGDENGEPVQLKGIASSLNTAPVTSSVTGANATVPDLLDLTEGNYDPTAAVTAADLANYGWVVSVEDNEYADAVKNANEVKFIGGEGITVEGKTNENVREITISVDTQNLTPENDPTTGTPTGKIEVPTADNGGNNFVTANTVANAINAAGWLTNSTSASVNEDDTDTLINAGDQVNFEKGANLELTKQVTTENGKDTVTYTYSTVMNPVFENVTTGGDVTYEDKDGNPLTKNEDGTYTNPATGETVNPSDVVVKAENPIFMGKDDAGNNVVSGLDSHLPAAAPTDESGNPLTVKYVTDPNNPDAAPTPVYYNADGSEYTGDVQPITNVKNVANPYSADNPAPVSEAATLGDVLNAGWNLQITKGEGGKEEKVDFVTPYNTVNFIADGGIEISQTSDGDLSNITIRLSDAGVLKLEEMKNNPAGDSTTQPSGKVEVGENPGGFVSAQNVANMINGVGWKTNSTTAVETTGENDVTGEKAENTNLVNAGDQVNFEAGKNMEITKEVAKGDNDEDVITYTYRTAEEVDFDKVTLSTANEAPVYTDAAGNTVTKQGDKFVNDAGEEVPADEVVTKQPTTVNLVSQQGSPVSNAGTGQEETQTPPALNITGTDADGNPSPTQLTGVASVLNTKPTDTAPAGSTDGNPTATSPLLDLGNVDKDGKSDLPQEVLNSAVTVGDLVNMGWVVSAADNNYTDIVKNANEVKFNGENGISVTGETTADGIRNINISLATGDVVTTNSEKPQGVDENNNPIDLVKVGDQYFAAGDVVNGVPNKNAAPYTGPVTQTTTNGKGFVTGNQVADAIQESGWTVAINNDAAGETVRTPDQVEKVNPNDNVRFADGSNTQVRMITKEVIEPNGVNSTTTTVRIDAVVPTVYTDKNGNKVAQAADGNWYTLDENGLPNTAATPVPAGDIIASMVNPTNAVDNPTAGSPTTLSNLASTLPGAEGVAAGDVGVEDGDISPAATKRAAPTLTAAQKSNAATVDDVLNAGWNLQENGNAKDFVKSYDTVNFVNGTGTEVNITTTPDGLASNVTVNVKTENSDTITLGVNPVTGNIQANAITAPLAMEGTTDANGNPVTNADGSPVTTGRVVVPTNPNALVSAAQVANAINNSGFDLDIGSEGTGKVTANDEKVARVNPGTKVTVNAGNNIEIKRSGSDITIATSSNPVFENIQVGGSTGPVISSTANGDVKIAKANGAPARITNVAAGVDPMDAVNVQQFKDGLRAVDKRARRGIATAAAMGHLPQPHLDGHSMFSVGTVSYRGEQGVAVGYSRISDNGKHIIKLSGATNTSGRKDVMVGASYGYEW